MKVTRLRDVPTTTIDTSLFTAPVGSQTVVSEADAQYNVAYIHFPDGVRNRMHTHTSDQVLIVTEGSGFIATDDEKLEIAVGDVVHIPTGERHWHGAAPGTTMTHITVTAAGTVVEQVEQ